jgi:hypothetical protein
MAGKTLSVEDLKRTLNPNGEKLTDKQELAFAILLWKFVRSASSTNSTIINLIDKNLDVALQSIRMAKLVGNDVLLELQKLLNRFNVIKIDIRSEDEVVCNRPKMKPGPKPKKKPLAEQ